ncbi:GGDEF domain-containing protein [Nitriliruptor alkaliphilus]|uniref:GGDEF domain-containing protein n=1 Tax=Nitriliruptor alkaliphilus TaxID=427918 RepID=UPI0006983E2F|nr:GGDEF domain-containing protein [Nitriliruptor alkaliphilus]
MDHELATALTLAEERFRLAFDEAPIGIAVVHPDGRFEDINPALCALLDRTREELLGTRLRDLTHPDDLDAPPIEHGDLLAGVTDSYAMDRRYLQRSGAEVWVNLHVSALRDHTGSIERFLVQVVDLTERKALEAKLSHAATHDPLTGLPNRRLVEDRLALALAASRRDAGTIAVLFCDLDGFKAVNDTHGHRIGDLLLTTVADRLRGVAREIDTVGRIGGDEFVVVAGSITDPEDAEQLAARVRRAIEQPVDLEGVHLTPRVSVGLHLADGYDTTDEVLSFADRRMYEAKTDRRLAVRTSRR